MKSVKTLIAGSLLLASASASAEVTLQLHKDLQALIVNGESQGFSLTGHNEFVLPDGQNQVVVRVSKLLPLGSEYEKFNSRPMVLTFDATNTVVEILPSREIRRPNEVDGFDVKPSVKVNGVELSSIAFHQGLLQRAPGMLPDYNRDLVAYNNMNGFSHLNEQAQPVVAAVAPRVVYEAEDGATVPLTPEELQGIFLQMSVEEKQAFMAWAVQNMN
uniref:DUF2057 family protein n=1 Tax=Thaumasiovibrio occultus TaxID=1891184 RepID=UPI00131BD0F4|nr:DUF2057 family protein [Thaumasiovibrio occultus]